MVRTKILLLFEEIISLKNHIYYGQKTHVLWRKKRTQKLPFTSQTSPYFVWASQILLRLITGNTFGSRELDLKIQSFVLAQKEG